VTSATPGPVEAARLLRRDALDAFELAALDFDAVRRIAMTDPADLVAAEARLERCRERFWVADTALREARQDSRTG
jgi:hypothetical protein